MAFEWDNSAEEKVPTIGWLHKSIENARQAVSYAQKDILQAKTEMAIIMRARIKDIIKEAYPSLSQAQIMDFDKKLDRWEVSVDGDRIATPWLFTRSGSYWMAVLPVDDLNWLSYEKVSTEWYHLQWEDRDGNAGINIVPTQIRFTIHDKRA